MKARILLTAAAIFSFTIIFHSCKKESSSGNTDFTTEASVQSDDQSRFSGEIDAANNDANAALESSTLTGRNTNVQICNATVVVDSASNPRTITITYTGAGCVGNTTRTGSIVISIPQGTHWRDAGAAITVTYNALKITRLSDNKSITINGSHTLTNVTGGLLINLPALGTIKHSITSSNMSVTFDNGTQRTWQVSKERTFTYANGVVISTRGTHTDGNVTGIAEWGTTREGRPFTTRTAEPLVVRQDCLMRLTSGKVVHTVGALFTATTTFGLDAQGNPVSCPVGSYYMKVEWTGPNGTTHTALYPY